MTESGLSPIQDVMKWRSQEILEGGDDYFDPVEDTRDDIVRALRQYAHLYLELLADYVAVRDALREVERHCPCGARPESLNTHPHVISCPVARALGARTVADNYNDAVREREPQAPSGSAPGLCPNGQPDPRWSCRFCHVRIHSGGDQCDCSTYREPTHGASLCTPCAKALDALMADTTVGRVHRALVHAADMAGRPSSDD